MHGNRDEAAVAVGQDFSRLGWAQPCCAWGLLALDADVLLVPPTNEKAPIFSEAL